MQGMRTISPVLPLAILGALLLPSCGLFKKKRKDLPRTPNIRLSGRVQAVNKEGKFVLIRRYGPWKVDEGQVVESRGDGRSANLMPTGEKLGEHVAADIRSGEVEVGDAVYIRRVGKKTDAAPTPPAVSPAAAPIPPEPDPGTTQNTPNPPQNTPENPGAPGDQR